MSIEVVRVYLRLSECHLRLCECQRRQWECLGGFSVPVEAASVFIGREIVVETLW
jgi:hypothetical protein